MGLTQFLPPWLTVCIISATLGVSLAPQPVAAQGLREAFDAAWRRQPLAQAQEARQETFAARQTAAAAWLPGPPALSVDHETDRINRNDGLRKLIGEIAVPLWLPGQQDRAQAVVGAERVAFDAQLSLARLALAAEVREGYWQARFATADTQAAQAALAGISALEADVLRRVKAGELAQVDANRASAEVQLARLTLAEAQTRAQRALASFRALTGLERLPEAGEAPAPPKPSEYDNHPEMRAATQSAEAARARLAQTAGDTRDAPELGIGTSRARSDATKPWEQTMLVRLRIPLGSDNRNRPRIAAASAELAEAQAAGLRARSRIEAEWVSATAERQTALAALPLAESRAALARDTQRLIARGFTAGEFDLPTRLRAEREFVDAESGQLRARLEAGRAESRLKQAYGLTP